MGLRRCQRFDAVERPERERQSCSYGRHTEVEAGERSCKWLARCETSVDMR